ncbi:MAG: urease accessory protein UreD [Burkholderiaceae bacterium]
MPWHAQLSLDYRHAAGRTALHHTHNGPLRVLKSLYPEGEPDLPQRDRASTRRPGGGGRAGRDGGGGRGAHALISTPGATRFYGTDGPETTQQVALTLGPRARLEWLLLEAIAYPGCNARNTLSATLAEDAELIAWDVTALGLPSAAQPYTSGRFAQRLSIPGLWLEQAQLDAADQQLLSSPLGLGGLRCMGTLLFASGSDLGRERRESLLAVVRSVLDGVPAEVRAGATCPNERMLVVRAMAPLVEPLMAALQARRWCELRPAAWGLKGGAPRIWRV